MHAPSGRFQSNKVGYLAKNLSHLGKFSSTMAQLRCNNLSCCFSAILVKRSLGPLLQIDR